MIVSCKGGVTRSESQYFIDPYGELCNDDDDNTMMLLFFFLVFSLPVKKDSFIQIKYLQTKHLCLAELLPGIHAENSLVLSVGGGRCYRKK